MVAAYRALDKQLGKAMMQVVIDAVATGVPATLIEIRRLGRTLKQRAVDVFVFFDRPGTSNGPTSVDPNSLERILFEIDNYATPHSECMRYRSMASHVLQSAAESDLEAHP